MGRFEDEKTNRHCRKNALKYSLKFSSHQRVKPMHRSCPKIVGLEAKTSWQSKGQNAKGANLNSGKRAIRSSRNFKPPYLGVEWTNPAHIFRIYCRT